MEGRDVIACPHCDRKVRVQGTGKYRCPNCKSIFTYTCSDEAYPGDVDAQDCSILTQDGDVIPVEVDQPQPDEATNDDLPKAPVADDLPAGLDLDLYVTPEEDAARCEMCGRPGVESVCKSCGKFLCDDCAMLDEQTHERMCKDCVAKREQVEKTGFVSLYNQGFVESFVFRLKTLLFRPTQFFAMPYATEPGWHAYLFAVLCYTIGGMFSLAYDFLLVQTEGQSAMDKMYQVFSQMGIEMVRMSPGAEFAITTATLPFGAIINIVLFSLLLHLGLVVTGRPIMGLAGTMRVVAYSYAAYALMLIPVVGAMVAVFWQLGIVILGVATLHRMTVVRAALATFMPLAMMLIFISILVVALAGLVGGI